MDIRIQVQKFCDELSSHDMWMWGNTCQNIMNNFDYSRPSSFYKISDDNYSIEGKMKGGQEIRLIRTDGGWSIRWGIPL